MPDTPIEFVDSLPALTGGQWLILYVVYSNPSDYIGLYVVRKQGVSMGRIVNERNPVIVTKDLEAARAAIPAGLFRLERGPLDDRVILETWV